MIPYPIELLGQPTKRTPGLAEFEDYTAMRPGEASAVRPYRAERPGHDLPVRDARDFRDVHVTIADRTFTLDELRALPGRAWMRASVVAPAVLMVVAIALLATVGAAAAFVPFWIAGASFFFCNYAAARLDDPTYIVGPAFAGHATIVCLLLAVTAMVTALFD